MVEACCPHVTCWQHLLPRLLKGLTTCLSSDLLSLALQNHASCWSSRSLICMATFQVSKGVLRPLLESTFGGAACQLPYHDAVRTVYNTCLKQQRCMFCSSIGTDKAGSQQPSEATAQQSQPASSTASNNSNGDMVQGSNSPGDDTIIVPVQPPTPYQSASGYQETHFATDKQGNPLQDQLKVTLRAVERRQRQSTSQDVYELSRWVLEACLVLSRVKNVQFSISTTLH